MQVWLDEDSIVCIHPMGTRLAGVQREFTVSAWDGSGDTFQEVRLYRNGKLLQTQAVSVRSELLRDLLALLVHFLTTLVRL